MDYPYSSMPLQIYHTSINNFPRRLTELVGELISHSKRIVKVNKKLLKLKLLWHFVGRYCVVSRFQVYCIYDFIVIQTAVCKPYIYRIVLNVTVQGVLGGKGNILRTCYGGQNLCLFPNSSSCNSSTISRGILPSYRSLKLFHILLQQIFIFSALYQTTFYGFPLITMSLKIGLVNSSHPNRRVSSEVG